jgi:hypothetical protein
MPTVWLNDALAWLGRRKGRVNARDTRKRPEGEGQLRGQIVKLDWIRGEVAGNAICQGGSAFLNRLSNDLTAAALGIIRSSPRPPPNEHSRNGSQNREGDRHAVNRQHAHSGSASTITGKSTLPSGGMY